MGLTYRNLWFSVFSCSTNIIKKYMDILTNTKLTATLLHSLEQYCWYFELGDKEFIIMMSSFIFIRKSHINSLVTIVVDSLPLNCQALPNWCSPSAHLVFF